MKHSVDVLMGDFNMSFLRVIPELRSRGVTIDLAARCPWKTSIGAPCADSCGIFCLRKPGEYKLAVGMPRLGADDETGILARAPPSSKVDGDKKAPFDIHERQGGPGQPLSVFLPKKGSLDEKLGPTLTPSAESGAAVAALYEATQGKGRGKEAHGVLKIQEKRLDVNLWRIGGRNYKGSHFPIVFFTRNPCRRSPDANERRRKKQYQRKWSAWTEWTAKDTVAADSAAVAADWSGAAGAAEASEGAWTRSQTSPP